MASQSLESMITTLFTAPGRAALEAEAGYRRIWMDWLAQNKQLFGPEAAIRMMPNAPVMKIAGGLELALTMRIASISQANAQIALGTGPLSVSGGYFRQTSEESTMSVRANFTLSNADVDLSGFLDRAGLTPTGPATLDKAIAQLGQALPAAKP